MTDLERAWHPASGQFRLAHSLLQGMSELNALYPNRSQGAQEGTVGDTTHRAEGSGSDHNPNAAGVVRAWDIDCTGGDFDANKLANYLATKMQQHFHIFGSVGYVIHNRQITSWQPWGIWQPYTGSDPHIQHIHISVGANASEYDDTSNWGLAAGMGLAPTPPVAPPVVPVEGEEMLYIKFVNCGPANNEAAIYLVSGGYLIWIDAYSAGWLHNEPQHKAIAMDSRSTFWNLPIAPGTRDLRGKK